MNTVGKILVILNFLFAIAVGALLIMVVALQTKWKDKYLELETQTKVLDGITTTGSLSREQVITDYKNARLKAEEAQQKLKEQEKDAAALQARLDLEIEVLKNKQNELQKTIDLAKVLNQRQVDEIAHLHETIDKRQRSIVQLEGEVKKHRGAAAAAEQIAHDMKLKVENLHEQLRVANIALTQKEAGIDPARGAMLKPNEPNRPSVEIEGKITKVDGNLVQISLGTDNGLKENNTLDVFRLQPTPTYLGMIRITDAYHHTAVGRLVPSSTNALRPPQLKEGDVVSSKIK